MLIEECYYYSELADYNFSEDYIEMMEYTVQAYKDGKIDENLNIADMTSLKMEMVDLDAIRWYNGDITTEELFNLYKEFYMRQG